MRLALMQPYFFPYVGYFDLVNCAQKWIVFDTAQYIKGGWIKRNRVLHQNEGWKYITVPISKHRHDTPIKDIEIADVGGWKRRLLGQLQHYQNRAPFYSETMALVEECLMSCNDSKISRLNVHILEKVAEYLELEFEYEYLSEMALELGPVEGPGDWGLRVCEAMGASEYVNAPGGRKLFDRDAFESRGIKLTIRELPTFDYVCPGYDFVPNLSIVDVLMWNEPAEIKSYLDAHH